MARQQPQLPGVAQAQPQARPVDSFVQTRFRAPIPREIVDLSQFSDSLLGLIYQSEKDAALRQEAEGKANSELGRPFGEPMPLSPELEQHRQKFLKLQEQGVLLPSEDPIYRAQMLAGEGRRVGQNIRDFTLSEETLTAVSTVFDKDGNLILQDSDIDQEFQRLIQPFTGVPALKNLYARNVAADMVETTRAQFHQEVSRRRDLAKQKYHTDQTVSQLTDAVKEVGMYSIDKSPEGRRRFDDAVKGLEDLRVASTKNANMPNWKQAFHSAVDGYILNEAEAGPAQALAAMDLVRDLKIGKSTIGEDDSTEGQAYRASLLRLEEKYTSALHEHTQREIDLLRLNREKFASQADDEISKIFAAADRAGRAPVSALTEAEAWARQAPPEYQDEALAKARQLYQAYAAPQPDDPSATRDVDTLLLTKSPDEVRMTVESWLATGRIGATQRLALRGQIQSQEQGWSSRPDVQTAQASLKATFESLSQGKSDEAKISFDTQSASLLKTMNEQIQQVARTTAPANEEKLAADIKAAVTATQAKLEELKRGLVEREKEFHLTRQATNGKGQSYQDQIYQAERDGVISIDQADRYLREDNEAQDMAAYIYSPPIVGVIERAVSEQQRALLDGDKYTDLQLRAQEMAKTWVTDNREKYTSKASFDQAFQQWANTELKAEISKAAGGTGKRSAAAKPEGPTVQQVTTGERQKAESVKLQRAIVNGNPQVISAAAKPLYQWQNEGLPYPPRGLKQFRNSFGKDAAGVEAARREARKNLGISLANGYWSTEGLKVNVPTSPEVDPLYKRALLSTGAATPNELLSGEMELIDMDEAGTAFSVKMPVTPEDVDPWKTRFFRSDYEYDAWLQQEPSLRALASRYGISEEDFNDWKGQQMALLKATK